MARTKKLLTHYPLYNGKPQTNNYRYHNTEQRKALRHIKRAIKMKNKYADEVRFMSISKVLGKFKMRDMSWKPGMLLGGRYNIIYAWESYEDEPDLAAAAHKQLERRGKLGLFMGHKDKLKLYKREIIEPHFGLWAISYNWYCLCNIDEKIIAIIQIAKT